MRNLNEMRELKNVVSQLMDNPEIAEACYKIANRNSDTYIHNIGVSAINNSISHKELQEAKAARYLLDLAHAICCYIEDGNDSTFTIGSGLYPNAENWDWDCEE